MKIPNTEKVNIFFLLLMGMVLFNIYISINMYNNFENINIGLKESKDNKINSYPVISSNNLTADTYTNFIKVTNKEVILQ